MRFRLPISGLLRSFRRNFLSTFLFLFAAWLIAREIRRYRDRQLLEEFLNRPPPSPQVPPAPPATVEQLEAECRAARFAREALDQMWEPLQMDKNPDVRAQYEENLAKMQGPKGEDCKMLMAQRNFSRPQDEWRWIFKNLPFTLMIDLDRKRGEKRDPNKPRPEPYLGIPEKADAITRMDLLATLSFFAQQLTSDRYGQRGVSANTFDQFHVVQVRRADGRGPRRVLGESNLSSSSPRVTNDGRMAIDERTSTRGSSKTSLFSTIPAKSPWKTETKKSNTLQTRNAFLRGLRSEIRHIKLLLREDFTIGRRSILIMPSSAGGPT